MKSIKLSQLLTFIVMLNALTSYAQGTLEWTLNGSNNATLGPTTNNVPVVFLRDIMNPTVSFGVQTYTVDPDPLAVTISFANQQRSTVLTHTSTVLQGMTFGGRNTPSFGGAGGSSNPQEIGSTNVYNVFGADFTASRPTNNMYISSPTASPVSVTNPNGTGGSGGVAGGFDTQSTTNATGPDGSDANFGIALYNCVEPLYDANEPKEGRYYFGDLVITFNRLIRNPVIHVGGLGGSYNYQPIGGGPRVITYFTTELELANVGLTSTLMAGNPNMNLVGNNILNSAGNPNGGSVNDGSTQDGFPIYGAASGSVRVNGDVTQLVYRVYIKGSTTSDFGWSAVRNDILGSNRDPLNGDLWYLSISTDRNSILPQNLQSFNGKLENEEAQLKWVMNDDNNIDQYELQRSTDGINFTNVTHIMARNATSIQQYQYNDLISNLPNKIYYRLKIVFQNGAFAYSNIVVIRKNGAKLASLYPSPFKDFVTLEIEGNGVENILIKILDQSGKVIANYPEKIQTGGNLIKLTGLNHLTKGTYIVDISTNAGHFSKRIVKN